MAAVELINFIRPTVAVSVLIASAALALHENEGCREKLRAGGGQFAEWFVHEVRRFYPFTPFLGARVRATFEWEGYRFPKGRLVLLNVHGIDHDGRIWQNLQTFWPERFRHWDGDPFPFIPQGGGDHFRNYRCPGERITIEALKLAATLLARGMGYDVPAQDLSFNLGRVPTYPKSGFVIAWVRRRAGAMAR